MNWLTNIIVILFGFLITVLVVRILMFVWSTRTRPSLYRLKVLSFELKRLLLFAGEIAPDFYLRFSKKARNWGGTIEILAGPEIWVESVDFQEYCQQDGSINRVRVKCFNDLLEIHPLFKLKKEQPGKVVILIKRRSLRNERHFSVGLDSRVVFIESNHSGRQSSGVRMFKENETIFQQKLRDYNYMMDKSKNYFVPLDSEHYEDVLNVLRCRDVSTVTRKSLLARWKRRELAA